MVVSSALVGQVTGLIPTSPKISTTWEEKKKGDEVSFAHSFYLSPISLYEALIQNSSGES